MFGAGTIKQVWNKRWAGLETPAFPRNYQPDAKSTKKAHNSNDSH